MNPKWNVTWMIALALLSSPLAHGETELPEEVRTDVQRIYSMGEKFDKAHIEETCANVKDESYFRCFRSAFMRAVREKEPTVTGYVVLLSIGTLVLADERQKTLDSGMNEGEKERALQSNSLDTAELLIETLERVSSKANVIVQEVPVAENLRKTLRTRAESILKQKQDGRTIASAHGKERDRKDALLSRLSHL